MASKFAEGSAEVSYNSHVHSDALAVESGDAEDGSGGKRTSALNHTAQAFSEMSCMRENGQLCDVLLCVDDVNIPAHRLVLASCSPYFRAMFTGGMLESQASSGGQSSVEVKGVDARAVKMLIDYCYTSRVSIDEASVQILLPAASMLQLEGVVVKCCQFLSAQLHASNCLGFEAFSERHGCLKLMEHCRSFAAQHFEQLVQEDEFLELSVERVVSLLSQDNLRVLSESVVFVAALRWLRHDADGEGARGRHNHRLLSCVRFPLIRSDELSSVVHDTKEVQRSAGDLLLDAYRFHLAVGKRDELQSKSTKRRRPTGLLSALVAVGGGSLFAIHGDCEYYDEEQGCWKRLPATLQLRRARHATAVLYDQLYAAGGWNGSGELNSVERYCVQTGTWQFAAPLSYRRSSLGLVELGGVLYALGGFDGSSSLASAERYDPLRDEWSAVACMQKPRRNVRASVLNGRLLVCGGYDANTHQDSVEAFDPREGKWTRLANMLSRRSSAAVATVENRLYVTGGSDGTMCLNTVECYDERFDRWAPSTPMTLQRNTHDCTAVGRRLYCVGGNDGQTSLNSVESLDISTGVWSHVSSLTMRRSSVGTTVADVVFDNIRHLDLPISAR